MRQWIEAIIDTLQGQLDLERHGGHTQLGCSPASPSDCSMGRPAEVFARPVTMTEGRRLQRIGRTAKDPVKLRRAIVVLMSAQGQSAPDIAHLLDCQPSTCAQ